MYSLFWPTGWCARSEAETPANFLIGIPDLLGLDNVFFVLADWLVPTV